MTNEVKDFQQSIGPRCIIPASPIEIVLYIVDQTNLYARRENSIYIMATGYTSRVMFYAGYLPYMTTRYHIPLVEYLGYGFLDSKNFSTLLIMILKLHPVLVITPN